MKRTGRSVWLFLWLALMLAPACSRQPGLPSPTENAASKPLPFDSPSHGGGASPTQAFASSAIPSGTPIVIRLQSPLSSAQSRLGDQFQAVIEEPIVIQGQTLAPSGTAITGRVVAAKPSEPQKPGYLRLTLSSIMLNGKAVDVHASSIFSKGGSWKYPMSISNAGPRDPAGSAGTNEIRFSTGRRLTFHLIQPLPLQG